MADQEKINYWNGLEKEELIKLLIKLHEQFNIINISSDRNSPKFIIHQEYKPIISKEEGSSI